MVYQKSSSSNFPLSIGVYSKTCGLHSSFWHLCQLEARKTNCYRVLDCYNKDGLEECIKGQSRLSIHNNVLFAIKHVHSAIEEICAFSARSLLCLGPYSQYMVPICFGLKLLLRLDALNIHFYDFPLEVLELIKLRYLALTCNGNFPSSISQLQKLRYLIVHRHSSIKSHGSSSDLPKEIWDMKNLKHLHAIGWDLPNLGDNSLQNLLRLLDVTTGSCTVLKRVPNLKKLGISIELTPDETQPLRRFDHISHLTKLHSLKCVIVNPDCKPEVVPPVASFPCLPLYLHKLNLSGLNYPWEEMSKIASLPYLKVLKLRCSAFQGPKWEVENNGFPNLHFLLIEDIDLIKLKWAHGSFRYLRVLRIKHCYKLKELDLGTNPYMREIEVVDCNPLVEFNVKENVIRQYSKPQLRVHSSWKS